ncbi:MAG: hypothetical protein PVF33_07375 [Candidatus Latescibacterota bacterium]|jgi:hypothetical protein
MRNRILCAFLLPVAAALVTVTGCERDTTGLELAPFDNNPIVYQDVFDGIDYAAFGDSKLDAFDVVEDGEQYQGEASIKISVPDPDDGYAGGALFANVPRDLSQYNALAFWAKASRDASLDLVGYGNDNTGNLKYVAFAGGIALSTKWQRYIIPVPRTGLMVPERGLFYFAEKSESATGYDIWFDEIEFVNVEGITNPRPVMRQGDVAAITGMRLPVGQTFTTFDINVPQPGTITVAHSPEYFTFSSSDETVAVPAGGIIRVVGGGTADITAMLDGATVAGRFTISAIDPPTDPAPPPTIPGADVISLFSDAYNNWLVDTFSPEWDSADVSDLKIAGNDVKVYNIPTQLDVAVIEFATQLVDATSMTHIHIDIWVPQGTAPTPFFGLGLVSFGPDGVYNETDGDDSEKVVAILEPELVFGQWLSLDIPLADFTVTGGVDDLEHLSQIILRSDAVQLLVDNIYFYNDGS